jgi:ubiquinone/menaquinone biosynthesis C-methylase UbiE
MPVTPAETYQAYFVPVIFTPWAGVLLEHARPQLGDHVLDVACGTGIVARTVASMVGPHGRVVGLDVNPAMLAVARGLPRPEGAPVEWREESALATTLPDASFDLVLCQQGLQFFPDRAAGVREMRRVLKPDGHVIAACWQSLERNPAIIGLMHAEARHLNEPVKLLAGAFSLGDADELCTLFAAAGFQHIEVTPHQMTVRFPNPERFVAISIQSAAAAVPALRQMDAAARSKLADEIAHELRDDLARYIEGDQLASPMAAHIVVAY